MHTVVAVITILKVKSLERLAKAMCVWIITRADNSNPRRRLIVLAFKEEVFPKDLVGYKGFADLVAMKSLRSANW